MTQVTAGEKKLLGLGRYRFRERLSTSFFGGRYEVAYDGAVPLSEPPVHSDSGAFPASLRPRADMPLAMRLLQVDTQVGIERLSRAVQSVRDLEHRAVLKPLQLVRSSTRLGVITPNLEGLTLAQLLSDLSARQTTIPPAGVVRIALDVLEGLEALRAHATAARRQDWLFGGLTPDSILIGADGQSRLLDPGLAGAAARQPQFAHEAALIAYTAPEQTGPDATFDVSSDVFSLGVMLWEMLTGRPLFGADTAAQTLENVHRAPIERVQRHQFVRGEPIAFALAQAVSQALRRSREQRFEDYDSFTTALTQAGPVASPDAIAELVRQALTRETIDDIKARIASARVSASASVDASGAPVTTPAINLNSLSLPPARPSSAVRPKITVSARPSLPEPKPAASAPVPEPPTPAVTKAAAPLTTPAAVSSAAPKPPSLSLRLQDQVSAFPIGDLLSAQQTKHARRWPLAAAAVLVVGMTTWLLHTRGDSKPSATSGHAPAPVASPPPPTPMPPTAAPTPPPPSAASTNQAPKAVAAPAFRPASSATHDAGVASELESARQRAAATSGKRRSKSESKRAPSLDAPDIPEPASEPRRDSAPPEPQPTPGKFIPEDI